MSENFDEKEILAKYSHSVEQLRQLAKELNLSENEINSMFTDCFFTLNSKLLKKKRLRFTWKCGLVRVIKFLLYILLSTIILTVVLNNHQPTLSLVMRNVQDLIYPSLKLLRLLAIPVITIFPSLTEFYDESCLIRNPYFHVPDMDCSPCENVYSIIDLTGFNNFSLYQSGMPYIVKTEDFEKSQNVTVELLKQIYQEHIEIFAKESSQVESTNRNVKSIMDISSEHGDVNGKLHVLWRINRMTPARVLRPFFPKPPAIVSGSWSGQSPERFLMIDGKWAEPYAYPDLECSYVFAAQTSGRRTIILRPSDECQNSCRTVSVVLTPQHILYYNWWYWRPISLPSPQSSDDDLSFSLTYITSFC